MKRAILLLALSLSMIGWAEKPEAPTPEKAREQCWAVTKSGNRCKRHSAPGERYCRQHASGVKPKKTPDCCRSMTGNGKQCESKPVKGWNYCEKHLHN